jgi:hypothetical protein
VHCKPYKPPAAHLRHTYATRTHIRLVLSISCACLTHAKTSVASLIA